MSGSDTGDTGGVSPVSLPPTPPNKDYPSVEPDLTPPSPGVAGVGSGRVGSEADGEELLARWWDLARRCLPEPMLALNDVGVARVGPLLAERVDAGWSPAQLRSILAASPLPPSVRSMAGLVAHRLGEISPDMAPSRRVEPAAAGVETPAQREAREAWLADSRAQARHRAELARFKARLRAGRSDGAAPSDPFRNVPTASAEGPQR